ncbi:MAG TPA: hypothetical protein P5081_11440 [Phycisphaerae bacterium]|nr:hypothetical protein [Phycisphaerae bacterium]HRW53494.1 hypothetical protein [Phycisphaerae bacterium]
MIQFPAIVKNSFLQAVRQPVFGIIVIVTLGGLALAPSMTGWTLDDDNKMLRDIGLSTLLMQGLFLACFAASNVIDQEISDRTALTVVAKPVSREVFLLGKYFGILLALLAAHYLAGLAFFMAMRHGVLQTASESSDITVLVFGPGVALIVAIIALARNYVREDRFLPAFITMLIPAFTLSTVVLLFIDRDFSVRTYQVEQPIDSIPDELDISGDPFGGIVWFRPDQGNEFLHGHSGNLVRSGWKGPINDDDRQYLLDLVDRVEWRRTINFLVKESRNLQGWEVLRASLLIVPALVLISAIAVASSTRFGVFATFLLTLMVICLGLASDQLIKPLAETGVGWASFAYRIIPNFQFFWMVDALNEYRTIPMSYVLQTSAYGIIYGAAVLLLGMASFQTREVG